MSDNKDLKSKILLMRQKNFGEAIIKSDEKNDNKKPENNEIKKDEVVTKSNDDEVVLKNNKKGLRFFIFLLFLAGITYFFYKYKIDLTVLKDISKDFLSIIGK